MISLTNTKYYNFLPFFLLILILKNVKIPASEILELVVGSSEQDTGQKGKLRTLE